jgi:malonyl-CoA decarboxylase
VVEEVSREMPRVATFVTLSPAPNFADWLKRERANAASLALDDGPRRARALERATWWRSPQIAEQVREPFLRAAAWYYMRARNGRGCRSIRSRDSISAMARG